jgi:DNA-binding NarL/FixJ family response regulator
MLRATDKSDGAIDRQGEAVTAGPFVALVEDRRFLRECIIRSMHSAFSVPIQPYSTLSELARQHQDAEAGLVILSLIDATREAWAHALKELSEDHSHLQVVILASTSSTELARAAIRHGAKGYIPVTTALDVAIEAIRFVSVGGTYAPTEFLLAADPVGPKPPKALQPIGELSNREVSVVKAIRQGKSNKVIAYELNMCEGTVKVHVRNIMKKLKAKNRTEIAMKA